MDRTKTPQADDLGYTLREWVGSTDEDLGIIVRIIVFGKSTWSGLVHSGNMHSG